MNKQFPLSENLYFNQASINSVTSSKIIGLTPSTYKDYITVNSIWCINITSISTSYVFYLYNNLANYKNIYALYGIGNGGSLYCNGKNIQNVTANTNTFFEAQGSFLSLKEGYNLISFTLNGNKSTTNSGVSATFWSDSTSGTSTSPLNYTNLLFKTDTTWYSCINESSMNYINECFLSNAQPNCNIIFNDLNIKNSSEQEKSSTTKNSSSTTSTTTSSPNNQNNNSTPNNNTKTTDSTTNNSSNNNSLIIFLIIIFLIFLLLISSSFGYMYLK